MPSIKEKCVCQICICGKHHCGEEIKFPSLIEEPEKEEEETHTQRSVVGVTEAASDLSQKERDEKLVGSELIEIDTQSDHHQQPGSDQSRQRIVTITVKRSQHREERKTNKEGSQAVDLCEHWTEMKGASDQEQGQNSAACPAESNGKDNAAPAIAGEPAAEREPISISKASQRKTWQTSPEQVEELTRSLSRMRTDHDHGGYLYEKMIEKEKKQTMTRAGKDKPPPLGKVSSKPAAANAPSTSYDQPHLVNGIGQIYTTKMAKSDRKEAGLQKESFLPPLTGFSDSDSSFGSFSCSVEGDHHLPGDKQMQCICESLKKTKLEERESVPFGPEWTNIKYIDVDDNWIVTRPTRNKPRDNLRLEGPMEMETTFRSTYESTAQRMIERTDSKDSFKSKRSTAATSRASKASPQLYLNSRRGRTGATPVLRSAKKRRNNRNRPMTSLKAGGDGYYNTINRDAYKNFIIVNGEAKMVGDQVKLPKVVTKTTLTTSEEKNLQKYVSSKSAKGDKVGAGSRLAKNGDEKMVMIDGEEIRKFEKKSYISKSDGAEEVTDVERKIVRKVKRSPNREIQFDKADEGESRKPDDGETKQQQLDADKMPPASYTVDNISGAPKRPFHTRYQDNIKELGLLNLNDETMATAVTSSKTDSYRQHMRRLHETSKDFNLQLESPLPDERPIVKSSVRQAEPKQPKAKVVNGHAVMSATHKPFIIPQRIHRHKNECSTNVFEGDMDFTTTNRSVYGDRKARVGSAQRKRTAGRRYLKSSKRRNLFRQSSDSMFSAPTQQKVQQHDVGASQSNPESAVVMTEQQQPQSGSKITSTYKKQFDDRLYCPALDVTNSSTNDNFKYTGEAGGHKYYLSQNYS